MKVQAVISNLLSAYSGDKCRLSDARIQRMLYLVDWRSAIVNGSQVTSLDWEMTPHGPAPSEGWKSVRDAVSSTKGNPEKLSRQEIEIVRHVAKTTSDKNWAELDALVNSTYPIFAQTSLNEHLRLDKLAQDYKLAERYKKDLAERHWSSKLVHDQDYYSGLTGKC